MVKQLPHITVNRQGLRNDPNGYRWKATFKDRINGAEMTLYAHKYGTLECQGDFHAFPFTTYQQAFQYAIEHDSTPERTPA